MSFAVGDRVEVRGEGSQPHRGMAGRVVLNRGEPGTGPNKIGVALDAPAAAGIWWYAWNELVPEPPPVVPLEILRRSAWLASMAEPERAGEWLTLLKEREQR